MTGINSAKFTSLIKVAMRPVLLTALLLPISATVETVAFDTQSAQAQNDPPARKTRRVESIGLNM